MSTWNQRQLDYLGSKPYHKLSNTQKIQYEKMFAAKQASLQRIKEAAQRKKLLQEWKAEEARITERERIDALIRNAATRRWRRKYYNRGFSKPVTQTMLNRIYKSPKKPTRKLKKAPSKAYLKALKDFNPLCLYC